MCIAYKSKEDLKLWCEIWNSQIFITLSFTNKLAQKKKQKKQDNEVKQLNRNIAYKQDKLFNKFPIIEKSREGTIQISFKKSSKQKLLANEISFKSSKYKFFKN